MPEVRYISSPQNSLVRRIQLLLDKPRERREASLLVAEGFHELRLAAASGLLRQVLFPESLVTIEQVAQELALSPELFDCVEWFSLSNTAFEKIAYRHQVPNAVGVVAMPTFGLEQLSALPAQPLVLILQTVEKPGNLGAILRTADAAGVHAVIVTDPQTDLSNPNVIRSSLGAIFTVPVAMCNTQEAIAYCRSKGLQVLTTALSASVPCYQVDMRSPTAIVLGTEAKGVSEEWLRHSDRNIIIPMQGRVNSMNVSVSAAIVIFEAIRQRHYHSL
jgi:TrmH family RNA methyltransferase